ncbi:DUF1800 domain-containing protein [Brevundimonas variabilis]|uniref:Uncharacterized protein (DUF1800 family) n=1 Tax=Brevundimonas variabilis TaxID=74312 RepID=A0A7W9CFQ1_9CAUL|nr:DUF1800 family protein [Brevundimonas variabilis]MBB5744818.1 uncharacterized protein (DUF1800 family) [Brevundimonas variabilis]
MPQTANSLNAAIALTRFGMGARPGEIERVAADPKGWLDAQVQRSGAASPQGEFPSTSDQVQAFLAYQQDGQDRRMTRRGSATPADVMMNVSPPAGVAMQELDNRPNTDPTVTDGSRPMEPAGQAAFDARRASRQALTRVAAEAFLARTRLAATTPDGFAERWAIFWANHFTASATKFQSAIFLDAYEREAIRPHVFGRFETLAMAAEQHPAMLLYLDQAQSVGPNSPAGQRRSAGLNENLAREIMELHTIGSDAGYSQGDVTEFARALTGWSIPARRDTEAGRPAGRRGRSMARAIVGGAGQNGFVYRPVVHEPGERTVLGQRYADTGRAQGEAILKDLANRPETARKLARKISAHFVADIPPPGLVATLERAWTTSGGDLAVVARALIAAPEAWEPVPAKVKTPYDFIVSAHRAFGTEPQQVQPLRQGLIAMGQPPQSAPSPEGWPDTAADWAGPDALVKRLDWSRAAASRVQAGDPNAAAAAALGLRLGERTRMAVARAESRPEAFTLFLMSPEFQRR